MVRGFYPQIVDALKAAGYSFKRHGKGDHEIWHNPATNKSVAVDRGSLSRHSANGVMKQAGIGKRF
ncbi:MAG: hypothetical protein JWQ89_4010 [Devosia sp.]|uniref:type II toxin-antitoxin system HicA family toxin n=1 Tax=Devosia sp. TaxID=1871048 RepID=UPI00260B500D|nr:type II toxin-antitoxin system HicA family toxin [Devosia sp.]MDB5542283.1 hypothetical protein [Devosia sp.]